jgi:hypothetical protein
MALDESTNSTYVSLVRSLCDFVLHPTDARGKDLEEGNGILQRSRDEMNAMSSLVGA